MMFIGFFSICLCLAILYHFEFFMDHQQSQYLILTQLNNGQLVIIIEYKPSQNIQTIIYKLSTSQLHHSTKQLFPTVLHLHNYLKQHPSMLQFDPIDIQLIIRITLLNQTKYIYLPIPTHSLQQNLHSIFLQKMKTQALIYEQRQKQKQEMMKLIKQYQKEQFGNWTLCNRMISENKILNRELDNIHRDIMGLSRRIVDVQDSIAHTLSENQWIKKYMVNDGGDYQNQKDRRRKVYIHELANMGINKISQAINGDLQRCVDIDFGECKLKAMKFIQIFINLKQLNLSNNRISKIQGLHQLRQLYRLDLSQNLIRRIQNITNNLNLIVLILHTNNITTIQNIFHLNKLQILSLSQNNINTIPDHIDHLSSLVQLKVINNKIKIISNNIENITTLQIFSILGNPCFTTNHPCTDIINRLVSLNKVATACSDL